MRNKLLPHLLGGCCLVLMWSNPLPAKTLQAGDVAIGLSNGPLISLPSPAIADAWQWEWRAGSEWSLTPAWSAVAELTLQQGFPWGLTLGVGPKLRMVDLGIAWSPWLQGQLQSTWLHPGTQDTWLLGTRWQVGVDWFMSSDWLVGAGLGMEWLFTPHSQSPYWIWRLPLQMRVAWIWQAGADG